MKTINLTDQEVAVLKLILRVDMDALGVERKFQAPLRAVLRKLTDAEKKVALAVDGSVGVVCANCGYVKSDKTFQRDRCQQCNENNIWTVQ
jgi:predicted Zn-ribbon and HTH transcriptional regulator